MTVELSVTARPGGRSASVDELKGLAIFLVLVYHCGGLLGFGNWSQGQAGVDIFLALSGLGLAWSLRDEGAGAFLVRRLAALMPRYWAALAVLTVLNAWVLGHRESAWDVGVHALALQVVVTDSFYAVNGSLWFMGMIVPLYGAAAALRPWLRDGRADRVVVAGLALAVVCHLLSTLAGSDGDILVPTVVVRIPEFFLGLAAGCLLRRGSGDTTLWTPPLGWAVLLYGLYAAAVDPRLLTTSSIAFGPVWAAWYLLATAAPWAPVRRLRRAAGWFGAISFEFYLYHQPFVVEYNRHLCYQLNHGAAPTTIQLLPGIAIGVALTLGACLLVRALGPRLLPARLGPGGRLALSAGAMALVWIGVVALAPG